MSRFSDAQIRRYSRQILLREVGGRGQTRLGAARPVLFCPGEVGQLAAEYLWRGGVTELGLLAPTEAAAARLTAQLTATGYPGGPAQAISSAAESLRHLVSAAPGFTLLWLPSEDLGKDGGGSGTEPALLWACCQQSWGAIGQGTATLRETLADQLSAATAAGASGPGAMIIGSALALLAMQRILGIVPGVTVTAEAVWRIDLLGEKLPAWR